MWNKHTLFTRSFLTSVAIGSVDDDCWSWTMNVIIKNRCTLLTGRRFIAQVYEPKQKSKGNEWKRRHSGWLQQKNLIVLHTHSQTNRHPMTIAVATRRSETKFRGIFGDFCCGAGWNIFGSIHWRQCNAKAPKKQNCDKLDWASTIHIDRLRENERLNAQRITILDFPLAGLGFHTFAIILLMFISNALTVDAVEIQFGDRKTW